MEISLSTIVLIALIAAASLWVVRKIRSSNDDALVEGIRDDMQVSHGEDDADSERTIYQISNAAYSAYETAARPEDLDEDPDFSAGIELLSSSAFSVEDVTDYFRGDNAVISSMAAKALGRREDGSLALDAVLGSIGSVATWPLILGLDYLARTVPQGANLVGPVMGKVHGYFCLVKFINSRKKTSPPFQRNLARKTFCLVTNLAVQMQRCLLRLST